MKEYQERKTSEIDIHSWVDKSCIDPCKKELLLSYYNNILLKSCDL